MKAYRIVLLILPSLMLGVQRSTAQTGGEGVMAKAVLDGHYGQLHSDSPIR